MRTAPRLSARALRSRLAVAASFVAAVATLSVGARTASADHDAAMSHFEAGRAHVRAGRCDLAIPEFRASNAAERNVGATLNLGECLETTGKLSESYETFRDAQGLAAERRDERVSVARASAERLAAKLVTVVVRPPSAHGEVTLEVDGAAVPRARWAHLLVASGTSHELVARARGCTAWSEKVQGRPGETITVAIDLSCAPPPSAAPTAARPRSLSAEDDPGSTQRVVGYVTIGVGAAALVASGVLGGLTLSARGDLADAVAADRRCVGGYPSGTCDPSARSDLEPLEDAASGRATAATVLGIAGAVVLATGIAVVLLAPRSSSTTAARPVVLGARF